MVDLFRAQSITEALRIRSEQAVIPLAGGTDLLVRQRGWSGTLPTFSQPVLYLGEIGELKKIEVENSELLIGPVATLADLLNHPQVPLLLKEALAQMASPAIRNMATLGGNICNASPAADTLPLLYAAGASIQLRSHSSVREMPVEAFILGPGKTALASDELMTMVRLPLGDYNLSDYRKVGTRKANALAKISFVGEARIKAHVLEDIRIAFGAVAPTVVRSQQVEDLLRGWPLAGISEKIKDIRARYAGLILPINDQRSSAQYRKTVALRLLSDFLDRLAEARF